MKSFCTLWLSCPAHLEHAQNLSYAEMRIELPEGIYQCYNGINIFQTRDYVKIGAELYIGCMLQTHGWGAAGKQESDSNQAPWTLVPFTVQVPVHRFLVALKFQYQNT